LLRTLEFVPKNLWLRGREQKQIREPTHTDFQKGLD